MDPLTAFLNLATKLTELAILVSEGQPPEVKAQIWAWWIEDVKWWRKALKLDA